LSWFFCTSHLNILYASFIPRQAPEKLSVNYENVRKILGMSVRELGSIKPVTVVGTRSPRNVRITSMLLIKVPAGPRRRSGVGKHRRSLEDYFEFTP